MPKGDQACENCALFEAPSSCKTVDGTVSPQGWLHGLCEETRLDFLEMHPCAASSQYDAVMKETCSLKFRDSV